MTRSTRRIGILLVIIVAAVIAFLSAGPARASARELDGEGPEIPAEDRETTDDLVVDLYLV